MRSTQLLIVRHGIAERRDPRRWRDDRVRPLSKIGVTRTRSAAAGLRRLTAPPIRVWSSDLLRARQTAAILEQAGGWPRAEYCAELAPGQTAAALWARLSQRPMQRLALIGHEPELSQFIALCLTGGTPAVAVELKKCATACLEFPGAAQPGRARLLWLAPPRLLRAMR